MAVTEKETCDAEVSIVYDCAHATMENRDIYLLFKSNHTTYVHTLMFHTFVMAHVERSFSEFIICYKFYLSITPSNYKKGYKG